MSTATALTASVNLYSRILSKFPSENLTFCFAYGSGVLKQTNNADKRNMIDFILAVDNAEKWHESNLKMNPSHYSYLSLFGNRVVAKVQTNIPSRVYFNSMIPIKSENVVIKYGVITQNDLIADLLDWNDLYVAGRLHKPVKIVYKTNSEDLLGALQLNLQSAVHASLLLLPEHFSEFQFYKTVTSLSYIGDFRMKFGEDKNKVDNIVSGGLQKFRNLYVPILKLMEDYVEMPTGSLAEQGGSCRQDISPSARHFHLNHLPRTPQRQLVRFWNKGSRNRQDTEDVLRALAFDQDCGEVVESILSDIVWESSIKQSLKGILTAGILTSVVYSSKKIKKMLNIGNLTGSKKVKMSLTEETLDKNNEVTAEESSSQPADCDTDFFGPALPPHLLNKSSSESNKKEKIYGPVLPDHIRIEELNAGSSEEQDNRMVSQEVSEFTSEKQEGEAPELSDDDHFGPSTTLMATGDVSGVYRFMKAEHSSEKSTNESSMKRETWMMELPEKKRPNLGSLPRHFKTAAQQVAEGDDSVWTDTPADRKKKEGHKKKDHKKILEVKRLEERDKEMEKLARKAAKLKKQQSLLEMHLKKMKKKKKKEAKKREDGKTVPERRPFDRNVDLQIRKIDENQRRAILNKSQFLNDRFAAGQSKFL